MPQTKDVLSRLPPSLKDELDELWRDLTGRLPASARRPRLGDMLGVLVIATRDAKDALPAALKTYFEIEAEGRDSEQ